MTNITYFLNWLYEIEWLPDFLLETSKIIGSNIKFEKHCNFNEGFILYYQVLRKIIITKKTRETVQTWTILLIVDAMFLKAKKLRIIEILF